MPLEGGGKYADGTLEICERRRTCARGVLLWRPLLCKRRAVGVAREIRQREMEREPHIWAERLISEIEVPAPDSRKLAT